MNNSLLQAGNQYLARPGTGAFPEVTKEEVERMKAAADTEQTRLLLEVLWGNRGADFGSTRYLSLRYQCCEGHAQTAATQAPETL